MYHYITYFEIAAFIAALAAWPVIKNCNYLKLYAWLLFIVVTAEMYGPYLKSKNGNNVWLYNIQVPLQYLFYLSILFYAINNNLSKKIIIALSAFFITITIITEAYFTTVGAFNSWSYSFGSILVIALILVKLYEMLRNPVEFDFIRNPFFYMLFAFLLFNVGTLPYFAMGNWLWFQKGDRNTVKIMNDVMSILNYILYSVYTIAFVWMRKKGSF